VWKGSDPDLEKLVQDSDSHPRQVIQRYLADPLLIGGYKFHMRIHLLITNLDPLQAFVQENGQCLFATKPYTMASKTFGASFDPPIHVTNMCLNATAKNKENYFKKKPVVGRGQQIRMRQFETHMADNYPGFDKHRLWHQILAIAKDYAMYIAKAPSVKRHGKLVPDRHFELFGMDLMMDKDLKVWMCEVNTDPGLSYPDPEVLGEPNPDFNKEDKACKETLHDLLTILGLDAGHPKAQSKGNLQHWFDISADV
jgi:tubulin polyglutamylase TTLL2